MVKEIQYTNIKRVLDNLTEHPLLSDLNLEQVVRHTVRFIGIHGYPKLYEDKEEEIEIEDFRGLLPCDLIQIIQIKDLRTGVCMRAMTDTFGGRGRKHEKCLDPMNNVKPHKHPHWYIPPFTHYHNEPTFKTQGRVLFTSFPHGKVRVAYKAIPLDEDGFPLLIDNEVYLAALEAYIKCRVFTVKFDTGKIQSGVLQNAKQEYAWLAGQVGAEFKVPSVSEAEALTRMYTSLIKSPTHFDSGFRHMGDREYLRKH